MKRIKIDGKKDFARQYGYSENPTGTKILKKGTKLIHGSYYKINSFAPIETCFTPYEWAMNYGLGIEGYTYLVTLKQDIEVECYTEDEVRFEITKENVDIYYVGNVDEFEIVEKYELIEFIPTFTKTLKYRNFNFEDLEELNTSMTKNEVEKTERKYNLYTKKYKEIKELEEVQDVNITNNETNL